MWVIDAPNGNVHVFDVERPALHDSRKSLEIDWRLGLPVFTTTRTGLGYFDTGGLSSGGRDLRNAFISAPNE